MSSRGAEKEVSIPDLKTTAQRAVVFKRSAEPMGNTASRKQRGRASDEGDLAVVRRWLARRDVDVNVVVDKSERTVLHWASSNDHADVVRLLLNANADIEAKDKDGRTALHLASSYRHASVVKLLLDANADVEVKTKDGVDASSLEHPDDRTIGIDHFTLNLAEPVPAEDKVKHHVVSLWDFAGQDAYQSAHSLFFSRRTLYLICVDLHSYATAMAQSVILCDSKTQEDRYMDEFVDMKILKWIRMIFARQPDAEFAFVGTKADVLKKNKQRIRTARADLMKRLQQYVNDTVKEISQVMEDERKASQHQTPVTFSESKNGDLDKETLTRQHHALRENLGRLMTHKWLMASCTDQKAVEAAREQISQIIITSKRSFPMPDSYSAVLVAVRALRTPSRSELLAKETFTPLATLCSTLMARVSSLDVVLCHTILRSLHDLGDVLWYEDLGIESLKETVILNPLLLIDFLRHIVNHNSSSEVISHLTLKALPLWLNIDQGLMLTMKRLLEQFNLAHAMGDVMAWDSDLIVPAFWRSKTSAAWLFCGQLLTLHESSTSQPVEVVRVRWEYHFVSSLPESIFDQLVVAIHSSLHDRRAGPDWILYEKKDSFACRLIVTREPTTKERVLRLEAVAAEISDESTTELWALFERLCGSLESVLGRFRGLVITRHIFNDKDVARRLDDVVREWIKTKPLQRTVCSWLPPDLEWYPEFRTKLAFQYK